MSKYEVTWSYTEVIEAKDAAAARKKLRKHVNERNITAQEIEKDNSEKGLDWTGQEFSLNISPPSFTDKLSSRELYCTSFIFFDSDSGKIDSTFVYKGKEYKVVLESGHPFYPQIISQITDQILKETEEMLDIPDTQMNYEIKCDETDSDYKRE